MLIFILNTYHYLENAEMTPELHDGLISLSFEKVHDFFRTTLPNYLRRFIVRFLNCLKTLVSIPSFSLTRSPYIYIPRHSHYPTQIIFARFFKLASTGCFVRPLRNIILLWGSTSFWGISFTQGWQDWVLWVLVSILWRSICI